MSSSQNALEIPDGRLTLRSVPEARILIGSIKLAATSLPSTPPSLLRSLVLHLCCPHRHSYRIASMSLSASQWTLLPPMQDSQRKTLLLDLDETLVHVTQKPTDKFSFRLDIDVYDKPATFYISTRPYLHQFLSEVSQYFEIVLYTASEKVYADPITDAIDAKGLIKHRLYRQHCVEWHGRLVKDLSSLGRSLRKVVLVDVKYIQDSAENFKFQPMNGVKIAKFEGNEEDSALLDLLPLLYKLKSAADVREVLEKRLKSKFQLPTY